jgi:hypothetical protein
MANIQAMCSSFKLDLLRGVHAFDASYRTADAFKGALFVTSATTNAATAAYSATNEVSGTNYTAGGVSVTMGTAPSLSGTTAIVTPSASIIFTNVTLSTAFDCCLLYNNTAAGKNAVSTHTFPAQTIAAGTLTLTMPVNGPTTALLQIA